MMLKTLRCRAPCHQVTDLKVVIHCVSGEVGTGDECTLTIGNRALGVEGCKIPSPDLTLLVGPDEDLDSRFTPSLFKTLRAAFSLQPQDGRFVDFDPFSNTQVSSYGHRVAGCRRDSGGSLVMRVEVLAGLRRSGAQVQKLDYVLKPHDKSWRIADIVYGGESSFRLSDYLRTLLEQP